ncbi:MAG: type IV pilus twitching motility protein PilT [Deltaproteobacteria bacterium]|nr:type IV pilus twitching motility protein PilT [Deltaproteobacteria bacterium]
MDIRDLLLLAVQQEASDLHLSPGLPPLLRRGGDLLPIKGPALDRAAAQRLVYSLMTDGQRARFEEARELDFAITLDQRLRFRINVFVQERGVAAALRPIPLTIPSLESLGLPDVLLQVAEFPTGLVLVTGPTGSGKSTTLAALVDLINTLRAVHIVTIEDPIEFIHHPKQALVSQREVGTHTTSFASALRAALREDPDVLLVGEMRDLDTVSLALTAAETGHLVLATLHTTSATSAVHRVLDVFPAGQQAQVRAMLAQSLELVLTQRLARTTDGRRTPVVEVLRGVPGVRNLIRENKVHQIPALIETGQRYGMISLERSLSNLVAQGRVSAEEARRVLLETAEAPVPSP